MPKNPAFISRIALVVINGLRARRASAGRSAIAVMAASTAAWGTCFRPRTAAETAPWLTVLTLQRLSIVPITRHFADSASGNASATIPREVLRSHHAISGADDLGC